MVQQLDGGMAATISWALLKTNRTVDDGTDGSFSDGRRFHLSFWARVDVAAINSYQSVSLVLIQTSKFVSIQPVIMPSR